MLIQTTNSSFGYARVPVVRAGDIQVAPGRCLGVFGPNGVGKTTLIRGLVGLLPPLEGAVRQQPGLRIGYVPQHRAMEQHWPMTGLDVACLGVSARRPFGWVGSDALETVRSAMSELGVQELSGKPFAALSGGQQQRLILAGAIADMPGALVLDEPTDGLDLANRAIFLEVLRRRKSANVGLVLISHEIEDLLELADEVAWLHPGDNPGEPSRVEILPTERFSQSLTQSSPLGVR